VKNYEALPGINVHLFFMHGYWWLSLLISSRPG